jgi:TonB family protein
MLDIQAREPRSVAAETLLFFELPPEPPPAPPSEQQDLSAAVPQVLSAAPEPASPPETAPQPEAPSVPAPEENPPAAFGEVAASSALAVPALANAASAGSGAAFQRGGASPMAEADYVALLLRRLEEKKIYPLAMRKRGITGDVALRLSIRSDGSLGSLQAGENPPHPFLAEAALQTARAAAPFPVWEGHVGDYSLRVTIRFRLE